MAINCYCGLQGSGKSYEVVSSVIVPAIELGRRVVTNIEGISIERIHEFIKLRNSKVQDNKLGSIVYVPDHRISESQFFPDENKPELESLVLPGDLVCVDEAWRFWSMDGGKLSEEHMQFFRMHRHYTHPDTGIACDVALMIQDISGLHRSVKNVVESSFKMTKLKSLGLNTRYRVEVFEGYKQTKTQRTQIFQRKYDKRVFPLYQSYAGSNGAETAIDSRQNVFKSAKVWFYLAAIIIFLIIGIKVTLSFFKPRTIAATSLPSTISGTQEIEQTVKNSKSPTPSASWRVVGRITSGSDRFVILSNQQGKFRLESPSNFNFNGLLTIGTIDGEQVTTYSGISSPGQGIAK